MRHDKTLGPTLAELSEFSSMVWRELSAYSPLGRRARHLAGAGFLVIGLSVASLVLYGIYRGLGAALLGPLGPVPMVVWVVSAAGAVAGALFLGVAAAMTRRSTRVPRFTAADMEAATGTNGHPTPIRRGSHTI